MATVAELQTRIDAAIAAMDAANWSSALVQALAAKAILSALPSGSTSGFATTWNAQAIDALIEDIRRQQGASPASGSAGMIRRISVVYTRAEPS